VPTYNLFQKVIAVKEEKRKLHSKTMTLDSMFTTLDRFTFEWDELEFRVNWSLILSTIISIYFSLSFGIPMKNLPIIGIEFDLEVDRIREVMERILSELLKPELRETYEETKIEKAVYGSTRYDYSYYDPEFTIYHIYRLIISSLMRRSYDMKLPDMLKDMGVNPDLADALPYLERVAQRFIENNFVLGASLLSWSKIREPHYEAGYEWDRCPYSDGIEILFRNLDNLFLGFILGVTPLSLGRFSSPEDSGLDFETRMLPSYRSTACLDRFMPHHSAYKLVDRGLGAHRLEASKRAQWYGTIRSLIYDIRTRIYNLLKDRVDNPFDLNTYMSAGVELATYIYSAHRGLTKYKSDLDLETFKKHWISKWSKWGLNTEILNEIYEVVKDRCQVLRKLQSLRKLGQ